MRLGAIDSNCVIADAIRLDDAVMETNTGWGRQVQPDMVGTEGAIID
jgi:hypothetical protein